MHRKTLVVVSAALVASAGATARIAAAGDAAAPAATAAQGALAVSPQRLERTARRGATGTVTVSNTTGRRLRITVRARPWRQSAGGTVSANRRRALRGVRVSTSRFALSPNARRSVSVRLRRMPSGRSLYGALEVVGRPTRRTRGLNINYRLVSSLRFNPTSRARRLRLSAGSARVRSRTLYLPVRNRGNTVDPVGGRVTISGPGAGRIGSVSARSILPGKRVSLRVASLRGLRRGSYTASVTLTQARRNIVSVSRRFRIR
jgi:hypothetical protein